MNLNISKVINGYLVQIPGGTTTEELSSIVPAFAVRQQMYNFVFKDVMELLVFVHHMCEPPSIATPITSKEPINVDGDGLGDLLMQRLEAASWLKNK